MEAQKAVLSILLFVVVVLMPVVLTGDSHRRLIVWNVGQGQWVSLVENSECWHFDVGGEFISWEAVVKQCGQRLNRIFLSHWDTDHISFATALARKVPACLQSSGPGPASVRKRRRILQIPRCDLLPEAPWNWRPWHGSNANDWSQVFSVNSILIPGDSPKSREKEWLMELPEKLAVRILILGHHGSRTSTSLELLQRLRDLRMAVASARFQRYGHPHVETRELLRKMRIPLLRTEDWGTMVFEL